MNSADYSPELSAKLQKIWNSNDEAHDFDAIVLKARCELGRELERLEEETGRDRFAMLLDEIMGGGAKNAVKTGKVLRWLAALEIYYLIVKETQRDEWIKSKSH